LNQFKFLLLELFYQKIGFGKLSLAFVFVFIFKKFKWPLKHANLSVRVMRCRLSIPVRYYSPAA